MSYPPTQPSNQPPYPPGQPGYPAPYTDNPSGGNYYPPPYPQPHVYPPPAAQPYGQPPPITQQPGFSGPPPGQQSEWMAVPQQVPLNVPPGLQYLTTVDRLFVHQKVELLEAFIGFETNNKYTVKNDHGQKVYYAVEENDCCTRLCCGSARSFDMKIMDTNKSEVIHLRREFACDSCWFPCCLQKLEVFAPLGSLIGTVEQTWSICTPEFDIKDSNGTVVLKLEGPVCRYGICGSVEFKVLSRDKSAVVGKISKEWGGIAKELFTDADIFGIQFPLDLDVRMKAVMLGALFLIDFMFFEKTGNEEHDSAGMC